MKKEKFVYNRQTLRYEKVVVPMRARLVRVFAFIAGIAVFSSIVVALALHFIDSPKEAQLRRELAQAERQYGALEEVIDMQARVLDNVQERDRHVHRMIFGMDPIDNDVWNGGIGGSDKYAKLTTYENTGTTMRRVTEKVDRFGRQLAVQSQSLDTIQQMVLEKEKMLASIPSIKPVRSDMLNRSINLLSGFGMRLHPIHKVRKMHKGIDFSCPKGVSIQATGDGKVVKVENRKSGYGKNVIIDHGYGYKTLYAHMSKIDVVVGQKVKKGQKLGSVGSTGTSTAPHLHYEVRYKGRAVDPIHYCMDGLTAAEYTELVELSKIANQSFD